MLINTQSNNYDGVGSILAQNITLGIIIIRRDTAPDYPYSEVTDIPEGFMQTEHEGRFGVYMDIATIDEITAMRETVGEVKYSKAQTVNELKLMSDIEELQDTVDEMLIDSVGA